MSTFELVIHTGITRHILILYNNIPHVRDIGKFYLEAYTKSKLIEWAMSSNISACEMPMIGLLGDMQHAKREYEERKLFSSQITVQEVSQSTKDLEATEWIMRKILRKLDSCKSDEDSNDKHDTVKWLVETICEELNRLYPRRHFQAILAGKTWFLYV